MASARSIAYGVRQAFKGTTQRQQLAMVGATLGFGAAAGLGTIGVLSPVGALYEAKRASVAWKRDKEATMMSNLLATAQVGPFGTGDRPYGMSSNHGGAADMTLALHYARNGTGIKDPFFRMAGAFGRVGRFVGENI